MEGGILIELKESTPGRDLVAVSGELDLAVAGRLAETLAGLAPSALVLIDLSGCEFIDSTGLATIVKANERQEDGGGRLAVFGATDQVLRLLEIVGLADDGLAFATREEALSQAGAA